MLKAPPPKKKGTVRGRIVLTQPMRLKITNWGIMVTMPGNMTVASRMANQMLRPGKSMRAKP